MLRKAFFVFESSPTIGAGHAIRSLVLADKLSECGWDCVIVSSETSSSYMEDLKRYKQINPNDFFQKKPSADLLVVDSYDLDYVYESHFRHSAKKIFVIDDLANRKHNCDILIDQTYARDAIDYKHLVPSNCKILTGAKYALLRNKFVALRQDAFLKRKEPGVNNLLISVGGSDPDNLVIKILEILKKSNFLGNINLVLGFSNENKPCVEHYLNTYPLNVSVHINPDMAKVTYEADIAIGGAGSSMWERCCLGLPTFMAVFSHDQSVIAQNLHEAKVAINLGEFNSIDIKNTCNQIKGILKNNSKIKELSANAFGICDGLGVDRIIEEINVY